MQPIYIVLTNTGTMFTKAIKSVTNAPYNHASLSLDMNLKKVYSFGRKQPDNPFYGGFIQEDFIKGTFSWYPETTCAIYKLSLNDNDYKKLVRYISMFEKNSEKYYYNLIGLFGIPFNKSLDVPGAYFCSQFVSEILKRSGVDLFKKKSALVTPDDFRDVEQLELIFEGQIYDYPHLKGWINYNPKRYKNFPFRKYVKQQLRSEQRKYYFRDGFVKPKKILMEQQMRKMKNITEMFDDFK
ncbi:hypothetical protein [Chengkuizengella sediminis]|uniref:hypothetical protein n=1 Tax=Chengkuizengella sediminis TaxID=1885917 RepID=UPI0030B84B70